MAEIEIGKVYKDFPPNRYFLVLKRGPSPYDWEDFDVFFGLEYTKEDGETSAEISVHPASEPMKSEVKEKTEIQKEMIKVVFKEGASLARAY